MKVQMPGRAVTHGRPRCVCRVLDLSLGGARISLFSEVPAGDSIELKLPGGTLKQGVIVWADGFEAGCAFNEPLDVELLMELSRIYGFEPAQMPERVSALAG